MADEAAQHVEGVRSLNTALENERRLIAAAKVQCWELVKWVVTLNIAIAGAQLAALNSTHGAFLCLALGILALFAWTIGIDLLRHTGSRRISGARKAAWLLEEHLETEYGIDPRSVAQQSKLEPREDYDDAVLKPYRRAIFLSVLPALLLAGWGIYQQCPSAFTTSTV